MLPKALKRSDGAKGCARYSSSTCFAQQNSGMGLFVRTIGIARARTKIGMDNLAYSLTRYVWHQERTAPA